VLDSVGQKEAIISMNEPLEMKGYTIYQASYEDADPRPVTSIFSVNRDPGRPWKYLGSALIVLGSVLLFAAKYRRKKSTEKLGKKGSVVNTEKEVLA
jgi:cytochrome c biogenesis protein ResB